MKLGFGLLGVLYFASSALAEPTVPRWSVIVYSGIDEEEIATFTDPVVEQLLSMHLPDDVELLIQNDSFEKNGVTRAIRRPGEPTEFKTLKEHDSASRKHFESFARWADQNARGAHRMFLVMTHSWGWKGIIQDYTIPGKPDTDTMMPLREFAAAVEASGMRPDVLFLDSCVLGNAEALSEFADLAPSLIVSQRETPYSGFPYEELMPLLASDGLGPRDVAQAIPERYVSAYTRGGSLLTKEGEFDVVTVAAVDGVQWRHFEKQFKKLVKKLATAQARDALLSNPTWPKALADADSNTDLVELLTRIHSWVLDPGVLELADDLLARIGYPESVALPAKEVHEIPASKAITVRLQADSVVQMEKALEVLKGRWLEANQDLNLPTKASYEVSDRGERTFVVRLKSPKRAVHVRPWLPGTLWAEISYVDDEGETVRERFTRSSDLVSVPSFPRSSYLISEAHSFGAPFIHGIGVNFNPLMNEEEDRATDPITGLAGPDLYRSLEWNRRTGWGDLILLK